MTNTGSIRAGISRNSRPVPARRIDMVAVNVQPFEIETRTRHGNVVRADVYLPKDGEST
jgi:hypothetical protein